MKKHAERLKKIMEENGLSKSALARIMGVSTQALVYWEQGKYIPNIPSQIILMIASTPKGFKAVKEAAIKLAKE